MQRVLVLLWRNNLFLIGPQKAPQGVIFVKPSGFFVNNGLVLQEVIIDI
jgi:hypothetical protein